MYPITNFRPNWRSTQAIDIAHWWPTVGPNAVGNVLFDMVGTLDATINDSGIHDWDPEMGGYLDLSSGLESMATGTYDPPATGLSLSFWMKTPAIGGTRRRFLGFATTFEMVVDTSTAGVLTADIFENGGGGTDTSGRIDDGLWRHYVVTHTSAHLVSIYVDGVFDNSATTSGTDPGSGTLSLGIRTGTTDNFVGGLADLRIYHRTLTADDAWAMWNPASRHDLYDAPRLWVVGFSATDDLTGQDMTLAAMTFDSPTLSDTQVDAITAQDMTLAGATFDQPDCYANLPANGAFTNDAPNGYYVDLSVDEQPTRRLHKKLGFDAGNYTGWGGGTTHNCSTAAEIITAEGAASAGDVVQIASGTYNIGQQLNFDSGVIIQGAGTDEGAGTATILNAGSYSDSFIKFKNKTNVVIRDLIIECNNNAKHGILWWYSKNLMVERCLIRNADRTSEITVRYSSMWTVRYTTCSGSNENHGIGSKDTFGEPTSTTEAENEAKANNGGTLGSYGSLWTNDYSIYTCYLIDNHLYGLDSHAENGEVCGTYASGNSWGHKTPDAIDLWFHNNKTVGGKYGVRSNRTYTITGREPDGQWYYDNIFESHTDYALEFREGVEAFAAYNTYTSNDGNILNVSSTVETCEGSFEDTDLGIDTDGTKCATLTALRTGAPDDDPPVDPGGGNSLDIRVAASADDAEEAVSGGSMLLASGDLDMGGTYNVGIRFALPLAQGLAINAAHLVFEASSSKSDTTNLTIRAQLSSTAAAFTSTTDDISDRPVTSSAVTWSSIPDWFAGGMYQTPDLSTIIQEVLDQLTWTSGNYIAFIITGTGARNAVSYNGTASAAPLLHVEYADSSVNTLQAQDMTMGATVLDSPTIGQTHALTASGLTASAITFDPVALNAALHNLTAGYLTFAAPVLGNPALGEPGIDVLVANGFDLAATQLGNPTLADYINTYSRYRTRNIPKRIRQFIIEAG